MILEGKTALVLGYGAVGKRIARGCLGMVRLACASIYFYSRVCNGYGVGSIGPATQSSLSHALYNVHLSTPKSPFTHTTQGMRVKAVRRSLPPPTATTTTTIDANDDDEGRIEMVGLDKLCALLPDTTALVLCLPGTGETEGKGTCVWKGGLVGYVCGRERRGG